MTKTKSSSSATEEASRSLLHMVWMGALAYAVAVILHSAYRIRMRAIDDFGPVIHEFDPYFNYRATEVRFVCFLNVGFGLSQP